MYRQMIKIVENALPQKDFDNLVSQTTNWGCFPWFFAPNSAYDQTEEDLDQFSWAHSSVLEGRDNSEWAAWHREICNNLNESHIHEETFGIRRIRFGMHTRTVNPIMNNPHIDFSVGSIVGLLYLNDSDGDTYFFDKFYDGPPITTETDLKNHWTSIKDSMKIVDSISPKANTMAIFDGRQYHCSSAPTKNQYRQIMNINWYSSNPLDNLVL